MLLFCVSLGAISVAFLALLSLIIGFSIKDWYVLANIEDQISSMRGKPASRINLGVWGKIQVIVFILDV